MVELRFVQDPIQSERVLDLLHVHLTTMRSQSPACSVHSLEVQELKANEVQFWTAWREDILVGCGAFKELSRTEGELKSMHIVATERGHGYARQLLHHLERAALKAGKKRLFLETGSSEDFSPARRLYESSGYQVCEPFGGYTDDPLSTYMTRALADRGVEVY